MTQSPTSRPSPDDRDAAVAAAAFAAAAVAIATLDPDGRVVVANPAFAALLRLSDADAARGLAWPDRVVPADRPRALSATAESTGAAFDVRLDAAAGDAQVACQVTSAAEGRRCLVLRDVTGRRRDERERQQFKFMADLASDAYFLVDEQSRIVYANRVAHAERGYEFGELVGAPVEQVSPQYDPARVRRLFESTAAGTALRLTHEHRRKDGTTFPVESSVNYLTLDGRRFLFSAVRDVSQQRAAEEALRVERERVALALQKANVGIFFAPVPMGEFQWDEQVRAHFFLRPDEPANVEVFYARMHPDDREPTRLAIARSVETRVPYDVIYRTVAPDGSGRVNSIRAIGRVHFADDGTPTSLDGVTIDVTREARDAGALRESEARFRHMADNAPVKIWITEADGRTSFVNARWLRYTGQTMEQALGFGWADAIHPDDRARTHAEFLAANAAQRAFTAEYRLRRSDGAYGWMIDSAAPRLDADGRFLGYIGSSTDISGRKEAEERVRESEERLQLAVAIAQLGTFDIDLASDAVIVNEAGRTIYGWDESARPTFTMIDAARHPDDRARTAAAIAAAIRPGGPGRYEAEQRVRRTDGTWRWVRIRGLAVFGEGPDLPATRVVGTFIDITEQKAADERREQLIAAEQQARAEAERAQRNAEAASRLKDEFLTTLSHELRTPLNAILGWATLLRRSDRSGDANVSRGLETIERNARVQAQLISDLLDVRHLTSGQLRIEPADADLAEAAADALAAHTAAAEAKGLRVETSGLSGPAPLRGDPARLRQVAWNLISNAVKFTPAGGTVRVIVRRADDRRLELRVEDTGQGIDPEFLPHVFDRFRQADASTTRRHGGLGVGLAIVRPLVELHGGSVQALSEGPGRGATFIITLPAGPTPTAG